MAEKVEDHTCSYVFCSFMGEDSHWEDANFQRFASAFVGRYLTLLLIMMFYLPINSKLIHQMKTASST